jgi:hypothetical protein
MALWLTGVEGMGKYPISPQEVVRMRDTELPDPQWALIEPLLPREPQGLGRSLLQWLITTVALLATTIGPLRLMVGPRQLGWLWCGGAVVTWWLVLTSVAGWRRA